MGEAKRAAAAAAAGQGHDAERTMAADLDAAVEAASRDMCVLQHEDPDVMVEIVPARDGRPAVLVPGWRVYELDARKAAIAMARILPVILKGAEPPAA